MTVMSYSCPIDRTVILLQHWRTSPNPADSLLLVYWLMYCRAPRKKTLPGEPVDLGEIGEVRELKVNRMTPYSIAEHSA